MFTVTEFVFLFKQINSFACVFDCVCIIHIMTRKRKGLGLSELCLQRSKLFLLSLLTFSQAVYLSKPKCSTLAMFEIHVGACCIHQIMG